MLQRLVLLLCYVAMATIGRCQTVNSSYTNPILPGWNSDPSCVFVPELDNTFFCTTSTFLVFPGIPVYASKDLQNWKLASHALSRAEQLPQLSGRRAASNGIFASTLRYHEGVFYLITSYIDSEEDAPLLLLFNTTDPYSSTWSDPVIVENPGKDIDPDLFWDDDGKVYMAVAAGIYVSEIDIATGAAIDTFTVWNGTGERNPEGPHIMKKDGYYYLWIAEGGTENNHTVTIARATDVHGPYEGYSGNPILTAKDTDNYFQTVGHADIFQDAAGNWWTIALATRSGPAWEIYPMGRETVLVPTTWEEGGWPVIDAVMGNMSGPLPPVNTDLPVDGPFWSDPDVVDFAPGSGIPSNFLFWQPPKEDLFAVSPDEHPNSLRISPSRANLTADAAWDPATEGLGFIARKQTSTLFDFSVDVSFDPTIEGEEAGVTVFLTQSQHLDLGVALLANSSGALEASLRFRVEASGKAGVTVPAEAVVPIPVSWLNGDIRLSVSTPDDATYQFAAASAASPDDQEVLGSTSALILSGGDGPFTGE